MIKDNMKIREEAGKVFEIVETKEEAVKAIAGFEKEMEKFDHRHCRICKDKAFMT